MADPVQRLAPVLRLAPAKLNLTLAVVGRRPDGYHALHSIMVPLSLADRLSVAVLPSGEDTLHVAGEIPGPPGDNLVLQAIAATRSAVGRGWGGHGPAPALAARLEKRIPVAAGLAGGSSDAAAAIAASLEAWGADLDTAAMARLAAGLGSDVPFFLAGGPALVEGRGEQVTALRGIVGEPPGVLLVTPGVHLPTPAVFAALADGSGTPAAPGATRLTSAHLAGEMGAGLRTRDLLARAGVLAAANDLWNAAVAVLPGLLPFRRSLARLLGRPVGMSGSGPTLWALYPSLEAAVAASELVAGTELPVLGERAPSIIATTMVARPTGGPEEQTAGTMPGPQHRRSNG
jgi:4-diphosphocytidyl-2-C-methyl-D-erythritol kinase